MVVNFKKAAVLVLACATLFLSACMVGPNYKRPTAPVPQVYKESPPASFNATQGWNQAQPNDAVPRGKWWEIYKDPQLNALEEQVSISNQNVLLAEAQFREARAAVRIARSGLFPTVGISPSIVNSRSALGITGAQVSGFTPSSRTSYDLPVDLGYQADVWGSIRRTITQSAETAQASAAQIENARLSFQGELAQDYFLLHGTDGDLDLLERTVKSYQEYLDLTKNRFASGVASGADVAQAETQLDGAQAQLVDLGVQRAQLEHAIAVLAGKAPVEISVGTATIKMTPPPVPTGVPSTLLERRPDIAAAERQMAAANEQIGIATAAFYPALSLTASAGFQSSSIADWFTWPSRFWSVGPAVAETLFDAGRRRAQVAQAQAAFDATVANYRQIVLTSFQQVEDSLAALRILEKEAAVEVQAVDAAERSLTISTAQYKAGTASYLQVITAQTAALQAERAAVDILTRRMVSSVQLIQDLGGGWDSSQLPTREQLVLNK